MTDTLAYARIARKRKQRDDAGVKVAPRRVNFSPQSSDFMCFLLSSCGLETPAIALLTGLTENQVGYRLMKAEQKARAKAKEDGKPFYTQRKMYRKGFSPVAKFIVASANNSRSQVKQHVSNILTKRGLTPSNKGVLK